jgi:hypothetical protein
MGQRSSKHDRANKLTPEGTKTSRLGALKEKALELAQERSAKQERAERAIKCGHVELYEGTLTWQVFEEFKFSKRLNAFGDLLARAAARPQTRSTRHGEMVERSRSVDAGTSAQVDTSGQLIEQRRSTATRAAAGAVVAGPVGAIVGLGAKKKETTDTRRVYLAVDADEWSELFVFGATLESSARRLAQEINRVAREMARQRS